MNVWILENSPFNGVKLDVRNNRIKLILNGKVFGEYFPFLVEGRRIEEEEEMNRYIFKDESLIMNVDLENPVPFPSLFKQKDYKKDQIVIEKIEMDQSEMEKMEQEFKLFSKK